MDWLIQHISDNPGHTVEDPGNGRGYCLTCGEEPWVPTSDQAKPPVWTMSRRQFLEAQAMLHGAATFGLAREAVASVALEHPEWDLDETRTWNQWNAELEGTTC